MLGLKRGTVQLVPHTTAWTRLFVREKVRLTHALGTRAIRIEHIGSTAIPGIPAKPILDIEIAVRTNRDVPRVRRTLERLGYERMHIFPRPLRHFYVFGPEKRRIRHVHVVRYNGTLWKQNLAFRDALRRSVAKRRAYAALKRRLAQAYPQDRESYKNGKSAFIKHHSRV